MKHSSTFKTWEPHLNAQLEVFDDAIPTKPNQVGLLGGQSIAIKDMISTQVGHTTAASKILKQYVAPFDATVVARLRQAGATIVSKSNLDEFAMGASNEYSAFGPVKNPWDLTRVAGGSSGGPAAAVAAGEVPAALGTDTGGSIRLPASFCNVVGLKPTYGRVSRFGVIPYASSFDQVGPFSRTVKEAAVILEVIAGHDPQDATSSPSPVPNYVDYCGRDIAGLTIGVPQEFMSQTGLNRDVKRVIENALTNLESLGVTLKPIALPLAAAAVPTYYILVKAEASSNMARYDGLRYGSLNLTSDNLIDRYQEARGKYFGPEVKRSILMGTYTLSAGYFDAWYKQASRVRTKIRQEFMRTFESVDLIAGPVSPEVAFKLGEKTADPLAMYLVDVFTDSASVAGLPAISVPCGFSDNLPVGLQLIAPHFKEEIIFQVAHAYEQSQDWYKQIPKLPK